MLYRLEYIEKRLRDLLGPLVPNEVTDHERTVPAREIVRLIDMLGAYRDALQDGTELREKTKFGGGL